MIEPEQQSQFVVNREIEDAARQKRPPKPKLRATTALLIFAFYLVGQFLPAFAIMLIKTVRFIHDGGDITSQAAKNDLMASAMPLIAISSFIGGAICLALGALIVKKSLRDNSPFGAAWIKGRPNVIPTSLFLGGCVALIYILIPLLILPPEGGKVGAFTRMAIHPGLGQLTWAAIALLLAPFIEELLFRGVMLGGFNRSFGLWWGVVLTNFLFICVHFSEAVHYWPAFIGIGLLAAVATRQRLATQAIGPAMAAHFGYNLIIVAFVLLTT